MAIVAVKIKAGKLFDFYAMEQDGQCDLLDFLMELKKSNEREFHKLVKDFDRTADVGVIRNMEKFKALDDGIHEFKTYGGVRVLCFFDGRLIIVTNGFMKRKKYDSEISKAINLRVKYRNAKQSASLKYGEDYL